MTQRFLSPTNIHLAIPTGTIVGYVCDPKEFRQPEYVQTVESPAAVGSYYRLNRDHPVQAVTESDYAWAPGSRAPQNKGNTGSFDITEFMLDRIQVGFELDQMVVDMARKYAKWDPVDYESKVAAHRAMQLRAMRVWYGAPVSPNGLGLDSATIWNGNTASAAQLSSVVGGTFANAQHTAPVIQPALFEAARRINIATNGKVKPSDLVLVINPVAAIAIGVSDEVRDFVKQQASSPDILKNSFSENPNQMWGCPSTLFGFKLVVEDIQRIPGYTLDAATALSRLYIKADNSAALVARPGGISAPFGSKSFSTLQLYWHKFNMAIEAHEPDNGWHKMVECRCVDYRTIISPAIESGYQITSILN